MSRQKVSGLRKITANYKLQDAGDNYFDTSGEFLLVVEDEKEKKTVLSIQCAIEAHFHADLKANAEFPKRFANGELRFILWPYFREFVSSTSGRMGIPPVTVPLSTTES